MSFGSSDHDWDWELPSSAGAAWRNDTQESPIALNTKPPSPPNYILPAAPSVPFLSGRERCYAPGAPWARCRDYCLAACGAGCPRLLTTTPCSRYPLLIDLLRLRRLPPPSFRPALAKLPWLMRSRQRTKVLLWSTSHSSDRGMHVILQLPTDHEFCQG